MHRTRLLISTLLAVIVVSLLTTGLTNARPGPPRAVASARSFKACATSAGVLVLRAGAACPTGSHRVTLGARGAKGARGPAGKRGATGPKGAVGSQGPAVLAKVYQTTGATNVVQQLPAGQTYLLTFAASADLSIVNTTQASYSASMKCLELGTATPVLAEESAMVPNLTGGGHAFYHWQVMPSVQIKRLVTSPSGASTANLELDCSAVIHDVVGTEQVPTTKNLDVTITAIPVAP